MESKSSDSPEVVRIDLLDSGSGCCGLRSGEHAPAGTLMTKRKGNRRIHGAMRWEWEWKHPRCAILEAGGLKKPGTL